MFLTLQQSLFVRLACVTLLLLGYFTCTPRIAAQDTEPDEEQQDYVQLFEQGQNAHEQGRFVEALEMYDRAIAAHPDFPEAEFQRAAALTSLNRPADAEKSLRHAMELRPDWSPPWAALGSLLVTAGKLAEAEPILNQALKLDPRSYPALTALVDLRLRGKPDPAFLQTLLEQVRAATNGTRVPAPVWAARAAVERAMGKLEDARLSIERALESDPRNINALLVRAELLADTGDFDRAVDDALAARRLAPTLTNAVFVLARVYARAGRADDALRALDSLDDAAKNSPEAAGIRAALVRCEGTPESLAVLEKSLAADPKNPGLLSCLGAAYRRSDPKRSLDLFAQAAAIEPNNIEHAIGYAGALVQARRFEEAAVILRRVLARAPDNYTAHTSLATALYELKQFPEAVREFDWIIERKPDLAVAYYFIATAYDRSGRFMEALSAYEKFLNRADPATNQLEIEKVNLRLPSLRKQASRNNGKPKK